jgi:hypothetical protein
MTPQEALRESLEKARDEFALRVEPLFKGKTTLRQATDYMGNELIDRGVFENSPGYWTPELRRVAERESAKSLATFLYSIKGPETLSGMYQNGQQEQATKTLAAIQTAVTADTLIEFMPMDYEQYSALYGSRLASRPLKSSSRTGLGTYKPRKIWSLLLVVWASTRSPSSSASKSASRLT